MRHLWSLLAGLVIAPLTWVLLAYANGRVLEAGVHNKTDSLWVPGLIIVVAGLLVGLITSLRVSPLGAVFAGSILTIFSVLAVLLPNDVLDALPSLPKFGSFDQQFLASPLLSGELLLVGVVLFVSVFSAGRWKSWPKPELHPTVGPVNPMVDTGRIEAIKSWSPGEEPTVGSTPAFYTPEAPTNPIVSEQPRHAEKSDTDGASPWAAPPTGR